MSNASDKLAIANAAMFMMGHKLVSSLTTGSTTEADKINNVLESIIKELMADDWYFNRHSVLLTDMTQINKLTVDVAPTAAAFARGATITGATSAVTCTVVDVLSSTVYLVTEPSDDFTDGEVLSDGTNSVDCAVNYPEVTEDLNIDQYQYGFREPTDCLYIRGIFKESHDKVKYKHKMLKNIILSYYKDGCTFKYNYYRQASTDVSDVTGIKGWFHRLISAKLAYMMSANITENQKIRTKAENDYDNAYLDAKEKNGSEEGAIDWSGHNDWSDGANLVIELNQRTYY